MLPNGVSKSVVLEVENMPQPLPAHTGFKCIVNLDDAKMMIPAKVEDGKLIVCEKTLVSRAEQISSRMVCNCWQNSNELFL